MASSNVGNEAIPVLELKWASLNTPLACNQSRVLWGHLAIRHPGQVTRSGMRDGIQGDLMFLDSLRFPFDFAQGGESFDFAQDRELVEPRVSPNTVGGVEPYFSQGLERADAYP
jgi:hypothetical protein